MRYKRVLANVLICSAALAADVPTSTLDASRNPLCGEFSLVLAASLMGRDVDFSAVRSAVRSGEFGASLAMLASGASAIGLSSSAIAFTPDALETAGDRPLIVWLAPTVETRGHKGEDRVVGHWVVVRRAAQGEAQVLDFPDRAPRMVKARDLVGTTAAGVNWTPALLLHRTDREKSDWEMRFGSKESSNNLAAESVALLEGVRSRWRLEMPTVVEDAAPMESPTVRISLQADSKVQPQSVDFGTRFADEVATVCG